MLDDIVARHQRATQTVSLSITGRYLPLLYILVSLLVASPHGKTVIIIDCEGRFDATRLTSDYSDLVHVHVYRPARCNGEHLREIVAGSEEFMLHGDHGSKGRPLWGTIVIGGHGGDLNAGWKGWLQVGREVVPPFGIGSSTEEAMANRSRRHESVEAAGWLAVSPWGCFTFRENTLLPPPDQGEGDANGR